MNKILSRRNSGLVWGSISLISMRIISAIVQFILTALLVRYLDWEAFSFWSLLISIILLLQLLDFGGVSALQNAMGKLITQHKEKEAKLAFFSMLHLLACIFVLFLPLYYLLSSIPWVQFSHLSLQKSSASIVLWLFITQGLRQIGAMGRAGLYAYQKPQLHGLLESIGFVVQLGYIAACISLRWEFPVLVKGYFLLFAIWPFIGLIYFVLSNKWHYLFASIKEQWCALQTLLKPFMQLWLLNLFTVGIYSIDPILVSWFTGIDSVGEYTLFQRLYNLILLINLPITTAMWSACTVSFEAKDITWIKHKLQIVGAILAAICFIGGGVILFAHPYLLTFWTGLKIVNYPLCFVFWLFVCLLSFNSLFSTCLNAIGKHKTQVICNAIALVTNFVLSYLLGKIYGSAGILFATCIATIPLVVVNLYGIKKALFLADFRIALKKSI